MSAFRGPRGCHQCGSVHFELHDWSTYVSVVCTRCGAKQGELERQGRGGTAQAVSDEASAAVREMIDASFRELQRMQDDYRRKFPDGRLGPPGGED